MLDELQTPTFPAPQRANHPFAPSQRLVGMELTLCGTGGAVPPRVVENDYFVLELGLDTTEEWIATKTGIRQRRYVGPEGTAAALACDAARQALDAAGREAEEVDLIVVATSSPDYSMPSTACLVQQNLGARRAMAFDLVNGCAGFAYALDCAARYLSTGVGTALVVGVDLGSRLVNMNDRSTCVFFGDGAGATLFSATGSGRLLATTLRARGETAAMSAPPGGPMVMNGRAIWEFATRALPETVYALCRQADVAVDDLRLLVAHQANWNILRFAADELGMPLDRVAYNGDRYGNTLAASIPLALDEALREGRAAEGDLIAVVGYGAGLAWGGQLLQL